MRAALSFLLLAACAAPRPAPPSAVDLAIEACRAYCLANELDYMGTMLIGDETNCVCWGLPPRPPSPYGHSEGGKPPPTTKT